MWNFQTLSCALSRLVFDSHVHSLICHSLDYEQNRIGFVIHTSNSIFFQLHILHCHGFLHERVGVMTFQQWMNPYNIQEEKYEIHYVFSCNLEVVIKMPLCLMIENGPRH